MAGFTENEVTGGDYTFWLDTPNVAERIRQANNNKKHITLHLDGDELDAALWGLANYDKAPKNRYKVIGPAKRALEAQEERERAAHNARERRERHDDDWPRGKYGW